MLPNITKNNLTNIDVGLGLGTIDFAEAAPQAPVLVCKARKSRCVCFFYLCSIGYRGLTIIGYPELFQCVTSPPQPTAIAGVLDWVLNRMLMDIGYIRIFKIRLMWTEPLSSIPTWIRVCTMRERWQADLTRLEGQKAEIEKRVRWPPRVE